MAIDADGAYRAYHPNNKMGLDSIEHAGYPGNWWALATDSGTPKGKPVVQGKNDPAPGFYVSMTSLFDASIANERNPRRFVDAARVPYVVLPPEGFKHAKLGDFATVVNLRNGNVANAIIADESAPDLPMGEGSIALARALGVDPDPPQRRSGERHCLRDFPRFGQRSATCFGRHCLNITISIPTVGRPDKAAWLPR